MTLGRPGLAASLRTTRDRLLGLGLAEDQVVTTSAVGSGRFDLTDLDLVAFGVEFASIAQRLQRLMVGGRGISVYVTGRRNDPAARTHTAMQLALALVRHGRQVVLVDADFMRPGLGGLIADSEADGVIDMVRFGRSTRSLLQRPVSGGPWLLPAGSFPADDPSPFEIDALRSVAYRVSQVCDLALYIGPLPIRAGLHPFARVCDHVVYAAGDAESDAAGELFESLTDLQRQSAHVLGVVLYAAPPAPAAEASTAAPALDEPAVGAAAMDAAEIAAPEPETPALPDWSAVGLPPLDEPPAPAPITDWSRIEPEPGAMEAPAEQPREPLPELERSAREPAFDHIEPWTAPEPAVPSGRRSDSDKRERVRSDRGDARAERPARSRGGDGEREYAFETETKDSRWPVVLVVTLVVLIFGFVGWTLWNLQRARQLETATPDRPKITAPTTPPVPDDADAARDRPSDEAASADAGSKPPTTSGATAPSVGATAPGRGATTPSGGATTPSGGATTPSGGATTPSGGATTPSGSAPSGGTKPPPAPAPSTQPPASTGTTTTERPVRPAPTPPAADGDFAVHVASFKTMRMAEKEIASLAQRGYTARAIETDLGSKGVWFRVYVGSFSTVADANAARDAILRIPGYDFAQVRRLPR